jgi:hypothetical protein
VRVGLRWPNPAVADVPARGMLPPAGRQACACKRRAEAASRFDGAFGGVQIVVGVGWNPVETGEATTVGHAEVTHNRVSKSGPPATFSGG